MNNRCYWAYPNEFHWFSLGRPTSVWCQSEEFQSERPCAHPPPIVLLFARPPLLAAVNWWAHLLLHLPPCSALFGLASQALGSFRLGQLRLLLEVFPIVWLRCAVPACFIFGYTEIFALSSLPRSSDFSPCKDLSLRGNCHMWQTEHCSLPRRL